MYKQVSGKIDLDAILALFKETSSEIRESEGEAVEIINNKDFKPQIW